MTDNDNVVNHEVLDGVGEDGGRVGVSRVLVGPTAIGTRGLGPTDGSENRR